MQKKKIKIVCLIGQLGNGGSEKQLYLFLKYLDMDKFEPTIVVSSKTEGIWEKRIREDIDCRIIFLENRLTSLFKIINFKYLLLKIKPDIVFSWSFHTNALNVLCAGGSKFIGSLRTQISPTKSELSYFHFKQSMSPDHFVVNSSLLGNELKDSEIPRSRVNVIHNIFEPNTSQDSPTALSQKKSDVRKQYGILDDEIIVAGAGRNASEKDFPLFVDAFGEAFISNSKLKAILIGAGGPGAKDYISNRGLTDKFIITGEVPSAKDVLPCADIFFLSSIYEGMPNVLLEAIGAGCAVLSTDVGGVRDIFGEDNPYLKEMLVSDRNVHKASSMLLNLADNSDLRIKISAYNRDFRIINFTHSKIMPEYYRLFESVLHSKN